MAFVTPRMSLKVWNASSDPYDHEQLADNFLKLDQHDHSQGRGTAIPGAGIQPGAITSDHIYPGSIGADAIADDAIGTAQLQDGSVTNAKLHVNARIPVGMVMDWYCAVPGSYAAYLPDGWRVCDGSTVPAGEHEIPGANPAASFTLPNLIGRVAMGADPAKALNAASSTNASVTASAPGVGGTGGTNNVHTHTIPAHHHDASLNGSTTTDGVHNHGDGGDNSTTWEDHSLAHSHRIPYTWYGVANGLSHGILGVGGGEALGPFRTYDDGATGHFHYLDNNGDHSHTVTVTGTVGGAPTDGDSTMTSGGSDGRVAHTGLLKIMKVKHV